MTRSVETSDAEIPQPIFLQPPPACGTEFEQVDWVGTIAVRLDGQIHAGIRFNDVRLMDAVAAGLSDRVVSTNEDVPAYFSVKLNASTRRTKTPLHYVYLGTRPVVGTRDTSRLVDGLAARLSEHAEDACDAYTAYGLPVLTPAGLLIVPGDLMLMSKIVDRVLRPEGFVVADRPQVQLNVEAGEAVITGPTISLDIDARTLSEISPFEPEDRIAPGSYPLAGWLISVAAEDAGPLRHAKAVLYASRLLMKPFPHGAQAAVDDIARLANNTPVRGIRWASDEEFVQAVLEAGRG